jgi:segregation and condensation protein B
VEGAVEAEAGTQAETHVSVIAGSADESRLEIQAEAAGITTTDANANAEAQGTSAAATEGELASGIGEVGPADSVAERAISGIEPHPEAADAPAPQEHAETAPATPQAGIAEPAPNHDPVSQADPAIPAHDSGVLRDTEHAAEPNPTTAAHGDPEDRRDAAQDAGVLTDDEPESRSA